MTTQPFPLRRSPGAWIGGIALAVMVWFAVYGQLQPFSRWAVAHMPIPQGSPLASAVEFFIYDTPKVLMLLTLVVFAMGVVRSFFSPQRTRAILTGKREGLGNVALPASGSSRPTQPPKLLSEG